MRRLLTLVLAFVSCIAFAAVAQNRSPASGQRFVVYFQEWSAALDETAQGVISQAAEYAKANPGRFAHVTGFADTTGSKKANELLTELRAQVVVDQLQQDGVPAAHIISRGRGSVQFALSSQESRRVEVSFGGR